MPDPNKPDTRILTSDEVAEIEASVTGDAAPVAYIAAPVAAALCQTLRAAWRQYEGAVSDFAAEINSLRAQLVQVEQERDNARKAVWTEAAQKLRDKGEEWRLQADRWQRKAEGAGMDVIREQDYADRDACLSKMAAAVTLANEFDEAAASEGKE